MAKTENTNGRAVWLRSLRSKALRRLTGTGLDNEFTILRLWIIYLFERKYTLRPLQCRHIENRPDGVPPCQTAGVRDLNKGMGLVLYDLKGNLRDFIRDLGGYKKQIDADNSDNDESEYDEADDVDNKAMDDDDLHRAKRQKLTYELDESQEELLMAFDSSDPTTKRKSTKVRVHVLTYLYGFTKDDTIFEDAYRRLIDSNDLVVLHLCGCGNCHDMDGCVEATHLELGSQAVNRDHVPIHAVLQACSKEEYPVVREAVIKVFAGVF